MSQPDFFSFSSDQFSDTVRLFPLPNLVMFPHVMQPLHVFEPRYRALVEDALADDRLLAIGLLSEGWEADYEGRPPVAPVACLGKIALHHRHPDGRLNILLMGVRRVRLLDELPPVHLYREVRAELCEDEDLAPPDERSRQMVRKLWTAFQHVLPKLPIDPEQIKEILSDHAPLGMLTDIIAYTLELDLAVKQQLLEEPSAQRRARRLFDELAQLAGELPAPPQSSRFPPPFSDN